MSVFLATKVKDGEFWLPRFISQVEQMEGVDQIAVMYSPSRDKSFSYLEHWRETSKHDIMLYKDPYLPPEERHGAMLATVKKDIQKLLEASGCEYYANLDCDLVHIPNDWVPSLMKHDKDIIASMNWIEGRDNLQFFDTYEFRLNRCRFHPLSPPGIDGGEPFEVDTVSTCYLAKAEVELAGEYSNPYPHIPFCYGLKEKGYHIWVDPQTHVEHIDLEALGHTRQPLPVGASLSPYINNKGQQFAPDQVAAQLYHLNLMQYRIRQLDKRPNLVKPSEAWLRTRPLITASYKIHVDDLEWLPYSLASVYEYVDLIDIATGPIRLRKEGYDSIAESTRLAEIIRELDYDGKIKCHHGFWKDKQEIQAKLLEVCRSKWMLFIDADEIVDGMESVRAFAEEHPDGTKIYARPKSFLNFWHDMGHIAYSIDPTSPWAQWGMPHPFLIHHDIPGLNFGAFHTLPTDGFGSPIHSDENSERKAVLDEVTIFHFGNAKKEEAMLRKLDFERRRGANYQWEEGEDPWETGLMPADMVLQEWKGDYPAILRHHPELKVRRIEITQTKPFYEFKMLE